MDLTLVYDREFFSRSAVVVARDLVGALLCRRLPDGEIVFAPILECEAYTQDDPACHAFRGKTKRTEVMFGPAGHAYVYFIYGMYFCLNVVTCPEGTPGAVLIRAVDWHACNGPGKLCKQLQITREHNGIDLLDNSGELWICRGRAIPRRRVKASERVGITQAEAEHYPWRFFLDGHPMVSGLRQAGGKGRK